MKKVIPFEIVLKIGTEIEFNTVTITITSIDVLFFVAYDKEERCERAEFRVLRVFKDGRPPYEEGGYSSFSIANWVITALEAGESVKINKQEMQQ